MKIKRFSFQTPLLAISFLLFFGCAPQKPTPPGPTPTPQPTANYNVYLTTDDGPMWGSHYINDLILSEKVPLTAFVVGLHTQKGPKYLAYFESYRSNPYITLGNHSYSHAYGHYLAYYSNPTGVLADIKHNEELLNLPNKMVRLPGRNSWRLGNRHYDQDKSATAAADLLASNGYRIYGWDMEWMHTQKGKPIGSAESIYQSIDKLLKHKKLFTPGHLILLMHDQMFNNKKSIEELRKLIGYLRSDPRIHISKLSNYPVNGPETVPPRLYIPPKPTGAFSETSPHK